jgi:hypothetical protein
MSDAAGLPVADPPRGADAAHVESARNGSQAGSDRVSKSFGCDPVFQCDKLRPFSGPSPAADSLAGHPFSVGGVAQILAFDRRRQPQPGSGSLNQGVVAMRPAAIS